MNGFCRKWSIRQVWNSHEDQQQLGILYLVSWWRQTRLLAYLPYFSDRMWMKTAARDLSNYQWRLVSNAIGKCSLPIFVKLVFAEICRWRSYTKPQETHLASTVMDSIMMLFERIEKQVRCNIQSYLVGCITYCLISRAGSADGFWQASSLVRNHHLLSHYQLKTIKTQKGLSRNWNASLVWL